MKVPVKDLQGWFKDTDSGGVDLGNQSSYLKYMAGVNAEKAKEKKINTLQNDGSQNLEFTLVGDSADVDINQISGTCASGASNSCATPNANIVLDITSDNAIIQLNQKDSSNDS